MCKPAHALGRLASLPAARCLAQAKQRAGFCMLGEADESVGLGAERVSGIPLMQGGHKLQL